MEVGRRQKKILQRCRLNKRKVINLRTIVENELSYQDFIRDRMQNQPTENCHKHHIIPRCIGGSDLECNLIRLSYEDHWVAHMILARENPKNKELQRAFYSMGDIDEYIIECKCHRYGKGYKSTYGKKCYHKGGVNKYFEEGKQPEGWELGTAKVNRKINNSYLTVAEILGIDM